MTTDVVLAAGQEFPEIAMPAVTRTALVRFAAASGDFNPLHIDIDAARAAGRHDVFAHGMLSMAFLGRALNGWVGQHRLRRFSVRFVAITPVHARPVCRAVVSAVDAAGEDQVAQLDLLVVLGDGTVTLRGQAEVALSAGPRGAR